MGYENEPTLPDLTDPICVKTFFDRKSRRVLTMATTTESRDTLVGLRIAAEADLLHKIHPRIFPTRRHPPKEAFERVFKAVGQKQWIVTWDIKTAFRCVKMRRLKRHLRGHVSPLLLKALCSHEDHGIYMPPVRVKGLPQGLSTSPVLFAFYVSVEFAHLWDELDFLLYVDNGYAIFRDEKAARNFSRRLRATFKRSESGLAVHNRPPKWVRVIAPGKSVECLGVTLA